jgi:hypothetical protein
VLITLFPQVPLVVYLTFGQEHTFPFETICGVLMLVMLVTEGLLGYRTLVSLMKRQMARFYRVRHENDQEEREQLLGAHSS